MKQAIFLSLTFLLLTSCGSGLPRGREMDDMALMRTMGVDGGDTAGRLTVTVSSGRRAKGLQGEGQAPLILSAQRKTVAGACLAMENMEDTTLFYGHIDQLLLGEALAYEGVLEPLEHFARDPQLGLGAQVWLVRGGTAEDAIRGEGDEGAQKRLSALQSGRELELSGVTCTVGQVLGDLLERGCGYLPALKSVEAGEQKNLFPQGYGLLREGKLVGWLEGGSARGLELMLGRPGAELLELSEASVQLTQSRLTCRPVIAEGVLTGLDLDVRLMARAENGERELLEKEVARWAKEQIEQTLLVLRECGTDAPGLCAMAGSARPEKWKLIREQWQEVFPALEIRVRCTATVSGTLL